MINVTDIAFITPLEKNKKVADSFGTEHIRFFEDEAIRCIQSWRKNGGWLKDIKIYVLNATKAMVQQKTIDMLKQLGVIYIDDYQPVTDNFQTSFLNEPFCGYYFEVYKPCKEKILIKTDLDMQLLKPIPKQLIDIAKNKVIIGQYESESSKDQRGVQFSNSRHQLPFDTNFIISNRDLGFYKRYFEVCQSKELQNLPQWKTLQKQFGNYYIEEFAIDWLAAEEFANLLYPVTHYQYGEGYASVDTFNDEQIQKILFLHEHIYMKNKFPPGYDAFSEHMKYAKRKIQHNAK